MAEIPIIDPDPRVQQARSKWRYRGQDRPSFAQAPEPGQLSVWDFPRPPRMESVTAKLTVYVEDRCVADTRSGVRVLETAGAPTYYFPPTDVDLDAFELGPVASLCEWKGAAQNLHIDGQAVGWRYVEMFEEFAPLYLWPSFYPAQLRCCFDDVTVSAQPGGYYGGWVTADLVGPIKGEPGSGGW